LVRILLVLMGYSVGVKIVAKSLISFIMTLTQKSFIFGVVNAIENLEKL